MVHQLKRDGYKLAVCSNSIRESVELDALRARRTVGVVRLRPEQ